MGLDRIQFARNIRRLRKDAGLTQDLLGAQLGITNAAISQIELGRTMPGPATLFAMAEALGVSVGVLLNEPLALAEHATRRIRAEVRALGYELALVPVAGRDAAAVYDGAQVETLEAAGQPEPDL